MMEERFSRSPPGSLDGEETAADDSIPGGWGTASNKKRSITATENEPHLAGAFADADSTSIPEKALDPCAACMGKKRKHICGKKLYRGRWARVWHERDKAQLSGGGSKELCPPSPLEGIRWGWAPKKGGSSSKFRGVSWHKAGQKWQAKINIDGKLTRLGFFDDEETAARKYDEHAACLGRPLNFPSEGQADGQALMNIVDMRGGQLLGLEYSSGTLINTYLLRVNAKTYVKLLS